MRLLHPDTPNSNSAFAGLVAQARRQKSAVRGERDGRGSLCSPAFFDGDHACQFDRIDCQEYDAEPIAQITTGIAVMPTIVARIRHTQTTFQRRERLARDRRKARLAVSLEKSGRFILISLSSFPEPRQVERTARPFASAQNNGAISSLSYFLNAPSPDLYSRGKRTFSGKARAGIGLCPEIKSPCGTRMIGEVAEINPHDLAFHHPYLGPPGPVHYSSRRGCEPLVEPLQ